MNILLIFVLSLILSASARDENPLSLIIPKAFAQDYTIDGSIVPQRPEDNSPTKPVSQTRNGKFSGKNYDIQVGFESFTSSQPFSFSVSENLIDYGQLLPTDPVTRTNTLSVSPGTATGYTVQAFENHSLKHSSSEAFIPDTTCDNGICTTTVAQPWNGTLTYGFGYRCDPQTQLKTSDTSTTNPCVDGFVDASAFRQFSRENEPQVLAQATDTTSAQISYKINISGAQAAGFYNSSITFLAVPNF